MKLSFLPKSACCAILRRQGRRRQGYEPRVPRSRRSHGGAQVFSREGVDLDDRAKEIQDEEKIQDPQDLDVELKGIRDTAAKRIKQLLVGKVSRSKVMDEEEEKVLLQKGKTITDDTLNRFLSISGLRYP